MKLDSLPPWARTPEPWLGLLLAVGLLWWALRRRVPVLLAMQRLGIVEQGANLGFSKERFQQKMAEVGWRPGDAWCMFYVKLIYLEAYPHKRAALDLLLGGSVPLSLMAIQRDPAKTLALSDEPKVGAIVFWPSHAGIVRKVYEGGFQTIEGNTSDAVRLRDYTTRTSVSQKFAYIP